MESRYYTPDISEFYIGFEYEVDLRYGKGFEKVIPQTFETIAVMYGGYDVRVKFLDKEDIESFGFKYKPRIKAFEIPFPCKQISNRLCHLLVQDKNILISTGDYETAFPDWENIFVGNIKNKSELKKILVQIGL